MAAGRASGQNWHCNIVNTDIVHILTTEKQKLMKVAHSRELHTTQCNASLPCPSPQKILPISAGRDVRPSAFNEYLSLILADYQSCCIVLYRHGNMFQKKLLVDSFLPLEAQH